jgi:hypothetical protein
MFFARMISMAKWQPDDGLAMRFVLANAVSNDVRLTDNTLSVWVCDPTDPRSIEDVVLALASTRDTVAKLDVVWFEAEEVKRMLIDIEEAAGTCQVATLNSLHRDLKGIDIIKLVRLSRRIAEAVGTEKCQRFTEKQVVKLIVTAIRSDKLQLRELREKIQKRVNTELGGSK